MSESKGIELRRQNRELRRMCERYEGEGGRWRKKVKDLEDALGLKGDGYVGGGGLAGLSKTRIHHSNKPGIPGGETRKVASLEKEVHLLKKKLDDQELILKEVSKRRCIYKVFHPKIFT